MPAQRAKKAVQPADKQNDIKQTEGLLSEAEVLQMLSERAREGSINALTALLRWYREHDQELDPGDGFAAVDAAAFRGNQRARTVGKAA